MKIQIFYHSFLGLNCRCIDKSTRSRGILEQSHMGLGILKKNLLTRDNASFICAHDCSKLRFLELQRRSSKSQTKINVEEFKEFPRTSNLSGDVIKKCQASADELNELFVLLEKPLNDIFTPDLVLGELAIEQESWKMRPTRTNLSLEVLGRRSGLGAIQ